MSIPLMILLACAQPSPATGPLSILVIQHLAFGGIIVQPSGGRITLTPGGSFLPEGSGVLPGAYPPCAYARVHLRGLPNGSFRLRVDPPSTRIKGSAGGSIQLVNLQPLHPIDGKFDGAGDAEVMLGGTLDIPAGTPAGLFSTTLNVRLVTDTVREVTQPLILSCVVRSPLTITNLASLDFGTITAGRGGVVRIGPNSTCTQDANGGPRLVRGTPHSASFMVTGPAQTPYEIILPQAISLSSSKSSILVNHFTSDQKKGFMPSNGLSVHVGADLQVQADQPPGAYKGVFIVTVAYQ